MNGTRSGDTRADETSNAERPTHQSRRIRTIFIAVAALLVAGGLALYASAPAPEKLPPALAQAPVLDTLLLRAEEVASRSELSGLLEAHRRVELFVEQPGRVLEVGAKALDRVEQGELLVRLDPLLANVAVQRAQAAIARAESEGILAGANLERNRGLANVNVASRAALDNAENAERMAKAALLEARANLAEAQDGLAKMTVTAPFSGVLRSLTAERGEYVQPGERIGELLDVAKLRIECGLSDRQIVAISPGVHAEISVAARPGERFVGLVSRVGAAIDLQTHKFPIEIEVDNPDLRLFPGMVTRIKLNLDTARRRIAVPLETVIDEFGVKSLFVVVREEDAHVVRKRTVKLRSIPFDPTQLEVVAGIAAGERIAISSVRQLRDGMAVRPRIEEAPGALSSARSTAENTGALQ